MTRPASAQPAGFPPAPALPELTAQEKTFTIVGALLGLLLAALDQTIVATAGPTIQRELAIEPSLYTWLTTAYLVSSTVMVPIYGKLSDIYGRKPILIAAIGVFLLGSFLCGVSGSAVALIAARAVQGLGAAGLFTTAFSVVADIFPPAVRGRYTGLFGAVFGLSSVVGPLLGGFITDTIGWHWVFFVNLPIGAIALFFIFSRMPLLRRGDGNVRPTIDWGGTFWLIIGVVPLLLALSLGKSTVAPGETGFLWGSWQILSMFALAAVGIAAFLLTERRAKDPILDLGLFENRVYATGIAAVFVLGAVFLGAIVFLPLFMVNVVGLSATNSGLTTTPLTLALVAGNVIAGQLVSRLGRYKTLMLVGLLILGAGYAVMAFTLTPTSTQGEVTLKMILLGLGLGPTIPLYTLAVQNAVAPYQIGVTTASLTFFRQMGSTIGVAILGTVFANTLSSEIPARLAAAGVPAEFRAQFAGSGGASGEGAASLSFDEAAVRRGVEASFRTQLDQVSAAVNAQGPEGITALLADEKLPAGLREGLRRIPPAALETPEGRAGVLAELRGSFEAQQRTTLETLARVGPAIKVAFTDAVTTLYRIGIVLVALGFGISLLIPEIPLRKTNAPGGAPQPALE